MRLQEHHELSHLLISSPFWKEKLNCIVHPSAVRMAHDLDPSGALGIGAGNNPFWKGFKHAYGEKEATVDFLFRVKKQHPEKIVLIQVGEFYETWGIDSVFLVEYCGLNRMGKRGPRAGAPLANIQAVLDGLTQAGFAVVVCEQTNDITQTGRKTRFISEIVTPSSPVYTYGLAMNKDRGNALFPDCPPEFGIAADARGMIVVEVNPDLRTLWTYEGLTREAACMRLTRYGGRLGRIFCHENTDKEFLERSGIHYERLIKISGYLPKDFSKRVEELIKIDLSLDIETPFMRLRPLEDRPVQAPRPVYQRTANQIGILPERGIPDLIEHMLPKGSPAAAQNLIRNFLLNPPPKQTADELRFTLNAILSTCTFFNEFPISNPARYVKTLIKREAGPDILKDLHKLAQNFLSCYQMDFAASMPSALSVISHILSTKINETALKASARVILETLEPVLPHEDDIPYEPRREGISVNLFETVEDAFKGRVAKTAHPEITKLYEAVERAAGRYEEALAEDLIPAIDANPALALSYDVHNLAIWLRGPANAGRLIHPHDRHGKPVKDRWSTAKVERALEEYKENAEKARLGVALLLGQICQKLASHHPAIVHLATFSNFMRTLILHVKECQAKGWSLEAGFIRRPGKSLVVKNFFPYWMSPHEAVKNTLRLEGIMLLTGHNMSGKSTLIRSLATTTLLAASGWMFPADKVEGSDEIDGWFVRTGVQDDPQSGLSAFAVEMTDVKIALRDATEHSLIFIDELGKGTESKAGHAIAAAVLEHLNQRQVKGLFATHWHELFFNPKINLEGIGQYSMQVRQGGPTYKVVADSSLSSSAFDTALRLGMDKKIIERAMEIAEGYSMHFSGNYLGERKAPYETAPQNKKFSIENARLALSEIAGIAEPAIHYVAPDAYPLFKNMNSSCLYVLKTKQGFFYIGETDNLIARINAHRNSPDKKDAELIYAGVAAGKSCARKWQAQLIMKLKSQGFPMLSTDDAKQRHFNDLQPASL
ncbi:MAG: hypothetical protein HYT79_02810 [Elusimicrobia bacterium]|nr:hypothetical protein [Elusimicrobiota bacterium]